MHNSDRGLTPFIAIFHYKLGCRRKTLGPKKRDRPVKCPDPKLGLTFFVLVVFFVLSSNAGASTGPVMHSLNVCVCILNAFQMHF